MATVQTGLAMLDQMTPILKTITNSLNVTLSAMEDMQRSMDDTFNSSSIDAARQSIRDTEAALRNLTPPIEQAEKEQSSFNNEVEKGERTAGNLLKTIAGFVGAYVGYRAIKGYLGESLDLANQQIAAEQRLQSIMSNIPGMTQDGIDMLKQYASELQGVTAIGDEVGIHGMSQLAQYVYDPNNIRDLSEAMYNLATETYGLNVSQDQIKQTADLMGKAMMGQIDSLSRNGFKLSQILSEEQIKLFEVGTEAERTAILLEVLNENQENLARQMAETPQGVATQLANEWGDFKEVIGFGLVPVMLDFIDTIQTHMPTIQTTFLVVFDTIFRLLGTMIDYGSSVVEFFVNNWSWIEPVIWGTVAALSAYLLFTTYAAASTRALAIATAIYHAILNANPFVMIITLIIGLITVLIALWRTNDNFAAGLMRVWNSILNFFDQVPIFFAKVGMGIVNAFMNMRTGALGIMDSLINGVIEGINWLIERLNSLPFIEMEAIGKVSFAANAAVEAEAIRQAGEKGIAEMEANAAIKALEREQKVLDMLDNRAAKRAEEEAQREERFKAPELAGMNLGTGAWNIDEIAKVGEVGKINDSVDISSEDLKMMRELAEMRNIQNFVTLTPTVQVTGDNHYSTGYDLDTVVKRIEEALEQQIASSAEGVYS